MGGGLFNDTGSTLTITDAQVTYNFAIGGFGGLGQGVGGGVYSLGVFVPDGAVIEKSHASTGNDDIFRDCSIATGAASKIARQEQGESTWDPPNAFELAPNSANSLIPSLIAWAKSQPPGNVAIVSTDTGFPCPLTPDSVLRISV